MSDSELRGWTIGMLILVTVVLVFAYVTGDLLTTYGKYSQDLNKTTKYTQYFKDIENQSAELKAKTSGGQLNVLDVAYIVLTGIYEALKYVFASIGIATNMFGDIAEVFGVPSWLLSIILVGIILFIAFEIISALTKYKV